MLVLELELEELLVEELVVAVELEEVPLAVKVLVVWIKSAGNTN